jgi:hypothetical protein
MDEVRPDRSLLEQLSANELTKLADAYGIDIPPDLGRAIIIEELMELFCEDAGSGDMKTQPLEEKKHIDTAPFPRHYNITFIEVLIRDPLWAFAFWEINANDKEWYEHSAGFGGYFLAVSPAEGNSAAESAFTVSVGASDNAWYLGFSPSTGGLFKVDLCALCGEHREVLAVSRPFRMPLLLNPPEYGAGGGNALVALSGVEDFSVLRNTDRSSRLRRRNR